MINSANTFPHGIDSIIDISLGEYFHIFTFVNKIWVYSQNIDWWMELMIWLSWEGERKIDCGDLQIHVASIMLLLSVHNAGNHVWMQLNYC